MAQRFDRRDIFNPGNLNGNYFKRVPDSTNTTLNNFYKQQSDLATSLGLLSCLAKFTK